MTLDEIKRHLEAGETLYVIERQTSRRGIPNVVSFYLLETFEGTSPAHDVVEIINIDAQLVKLIGEGARLIKVGRVLAASIHDPYLHTLEDHMEDLSIALFGNPTQLKWRVI